MLLVFKHYGFAPNVRMSRKVKQVVERLISTLQKMVDDVLRNCKAAPVLKSGVIRLVFHRPWYVYKMKGNCSGCSQVEVFSKASLPVKKQ